MDMKTYEIKRKEALNRRRRIIFDNDGEDVLSECREATKEDLLRQRTYQLLGTKVDTVFVTTHSAGFGLFTHDTKIGSIFNCKEKKYINNMTEEFIKQGTDHFRIISEFCRDNSIEIFWQMRMNDTHDGSEDWYGDAYFKVNRLKKEHPEWLLGSKENKPKYGVWSAVNYAIREIREYALAFIEEVCDNYFIDGISLDFFRHPVFFKSASEGRKAEQHEIECMTDLMRKIKKLVDKKGMEKGHPILIAVRVPDSAEYSKDIGLDIEEWLRESLVDLLLTSGYFRLNSWEYSVNLGHKYNAKVYPSLDESRVRDDEANSLRNSKKVYRARAMNALRAGADGIFLFNYNYFVSIFKTYQADNEDIFNEIGDIDELNKLDKTYVVSSRGIGAIAGGCLPYVDYFNVPVLNPEAPVTVNPGNMYTIAFPIGDDTNWGKDIGVMPRITLGIRVEGLSSEKDIAIQFNGVLLKDGQQKGIWIEYELDNNTIKLGTNEFVMNLNSNASNPVKLLDLKVDIAYIRL